MADPDFADQYGIIVRSSVVSAKGRNELSEQLPVTVVGVVQNADRETLDKYPDLAMLSNVIAVWHRGRLNVESVDGYSDIIIWRGDRYEATVIDEDWMNYGAGWTKALCTLQKVNNNA
jgi:hypothetical protein